MSMKYQINENFIFVHLNVYRHALSVQFATIVRVVLNYIIRTIMIIKTHKRICRNMMVESYKKCDTNGVES